LKSFYYQLKKVSRENTIRSSFSPIEKYLKSKYKVIFNVPKDKNFFAIVDAKVKALAKDELGETVLNLIGITSYIFLNKSSD
jgi:hypothetical protein